MLDIATIEQLSFEELAKTIENLINTDFEKLVFLLYRIDVSEQKINDLLQNTQAGNAGELIVQAI
ncbi:MAG TPA: hypothetical protein PLW32_12800, partial [Chitinophagaceae bacterium]|nr:hypothetical protein [Chitinophagaceae bacterium]